MNEICNWNVYNEAHLQIINFIKKYYLINLFILTYLPPLLYLITLNFLLCVHAHKKESIAEGESGCTEFMLIFVCIQMCDLWHVPDAIVKPFWENKKDH